MASRDAGSTVRPGKGTGSRIEPRSIVKTSTIKG
jgi:hypothetical protein